MRVDHLGLERDRSAIRIGRFGVPALQAEGVAVVHFERGVRAGQLERAADALDGRFGAALLMRHEAQQMPRVYPALVFGEALPIEPLGFMQAVRPMMLERLAKRRLGGRHGPIPQGR